MKKIIATVTFLLTMILSVNAQVKSSPQVGNAGTKEIATPSQLESAKNDAVAIAKFLDLNETKQQDFERLFQMKHKIMQDQNASFERKKEMVRIVSAKIAASMDSNQLEKLKANDALYKQMTGEAILK